MLQGWLKGLSDVNKDPESCHLSPLFHLACVENVSAHGCEMAALALSTGSLCYSRKSEMKEQEQKGLSLSVFSLFTRGLHLAMDGKMDYRAESFGFHCLILSSQKILYSLSPFLGLI